MYNRASLTYHSIKMSLHAFECNQRLLNSDNHLICLILYLKRVAATFHSLILLYSVFSPVSHLLYSLHGSWKVKYDTSVSMCNVGNAHTHRCHPCPKYFSGCLAMSALMSQRPDSNNTSLYWSLVCR